MATLSRKNLKHSSPSWMVNLTGILAILTPILPTLIQTMPGTVSNETKDWIFWILSVLTALSGSAAMFAKKSDVIGDGTRPPKAPR